MSSPLNSYTFQGGISENRFLLDAQPLQLYANHSQLQITNKHKMRLKLMKQVGESMAEGNMT